jgi:hypothetical protein
MSHSEKSSKFEKENHRRRSSKKTFNGLKAPTITGIDQPKSILKPSSFVPESQKAGKSGSPMADNNLSLKLHKLEPNEVSRSFSTNKRAGKSHQSDFVQPYQMKS